jgi:hypothetical protein
MVDGFSPSAPCPGNKSVGSLLHTEGGYPPWVLLTLFIHPHLPLEYVTNITHHCFNNRCFHLRISQISQIYICVKTVYIPMAGLQEYHIIH